MAASARRALLGRIEHELALIEAVPEIALGPDVRAVVALEGAPAGTIAARLRPARFDDVGDRRLHAIAALEARRFAVACAGTDEAAIEASGRALVAAWSALGGRAAYVEALGRSLGGPSFRGASETALRLGVERVSAALLERARADGDLGALLRVLREAEALSAAASTVASRARLEAIDVVLDPVRRTLDELATRRPTAVEVTQAFVAARAAWRRTDRDVEVEILVVERLADFAWDLYRARSLDELGRVLEEVAEPASSLAGRVERGDALAWAAPCAQVLVFRAELAPRFDAQIELAERANAVCPSLRNARLVLGDFLLTRAERALDRGASRTSAGTTPDEDVARAAALHPELRRLPTLREKLARRGAPRA